MVARDSSFKLKTEKAKAFALDWTHSQVPIIYQLQQEGTV